jgi:hypothetical protein
MRPIPIDDKRYCLIFIIVGCLLAIYSVGALRMPEGGTRISGFSKGFNAEARRLEELPRPATSP